MLDRAKDLLLLTTNQDDNLLTNLIDLTIDEVLTYCRTTNLSGLESTILQIVVIKYNRLKSEGMATETYNAASFTYLDDYPVNILKALKARRRLQVI